MRARTEAGRPLDLKEVVVDSDLTTRAPAANGPITLTESRW